LQLYNERPISPKFPCTLPPILTVGTISFLGFGSGEMFLGDKVRINSPKDPSTSVFLVLDVVAGDPAHPI
jgi:hypothetical protein